MPKDSLEAVWYTTIMWRCLWYFHGLLPVMESRDLVSVSRLVSRPIFWSLGLEGLRFRLGLVSKDFGLVLELCVSRLCVGYFLWSFASRSSSKKTVLKNDCSKFSRSKRSVAKLPLLFCCLWDGENNFPSTPFKIYTEFNKKCACTKETAAGNLCNERLGILY